MPIVSPPQFYERYKRLSPKLQEAMTSEKASEAFWRLVEILKVPEGLAIVLASLVNHVLAGFITLDEFRAELGKRLGLSNERAIEIVSQFEKEVFAPVKPLLQEFAAKRVVPTVVSIASSPSQTVPFTRSPEARPPEVKPVPSTTAPTTKSLEMPRAVSFPLPVSRITFTEVPPVKSPATAPSSIPLRQPVLPQLADQGKNPVKEIRFAVPSRTEEVPGVITPGLRKAETKTSENIAVPARIVTPSSTQPVSQLPKIEPSTLVQGTGIRPRIETPATPPPTAPLRPMTLPIPKPQPSAPPSMPSFAAPRPPEVSPVKLAPTVIQTPPSQQESSPTIQPQQGVSALTPSPAIPKVITPPPKPQSSVEVIDLSTFEIKKGPTPSTQ